MAQNITLLDKPINTDAVLSQGDGRHLVANDIAGATVYATIQGGKIVSYDAERNGQPAEGFIFHQKGGDLSPDARPVKCYYCVCDGDNCMCSPIPC